MMIDAQIVLAVAVIFGAGSISIALKRQAHAADAVPMERFLVADLRREIETLREEVTGLRASAKLMLQQISDQDTIIHRLETALEAVESENKLFRRRFADLGLREQ